MRILIRSLMVALAEICVARPVIVLLGAAIVVAGAGWFVRDLRLTNDLEDLLPKDAPGLAEYQEILSDHGESEQVFVIVRGEGEADLELRSELAEAIAGRLEASELVASVSYRIGDEAMLGLSEALASGALLLLRPGDVPELRSRLTDSAIRGRMERLARELDRPGLLASEARIRLREDPLGVLELVGERLSEEYRLPFRRWRGYLLTEDLRDLLIAVRPVSPSRQTPFSRELMRELVLVVNEARMEVREWASEGDRARLSDVRLEAGECGTPRERVAPGAPAPAVHVLFTGAHPIHLDHHCILSRDLLRTGLLSFAGVMLLFLVSFRRLGVLVYAGVPLAVGLVLTLAFARWLAGGLNVYTAGSVAMICGLGVDYGIHLFNRYLEERHRGRGLAAAFHTTLDETGTGVAAASMTTAVAYFALTISKTRGIRELGLICGTGMFLTLVATLVLMPALVSLVSRIRPERDRVLGMSGFGLEPLTRFVVTRYRGVAWAMIALTAALGLVLAWPAFTGRVYLDDDFMQFRPPGSRAVQLDEELNDRLGARLRSLQVVVRDGSSARMLDRTERIAVAVAGDPDFAMVQAATDVLPSPGRQARLLEELDRVREEDPPALDPGRVARTTLAAFRESTGRNPGTSFTDAVDRLSAMLSRRDPMTLAATLDSSLGPFVQPFVSLGGDDGGGGSSLILVNPSSELTPRVALVKLEKLLGTLDGDAVVSGGPVLGRLLRNQVRRDLALSMGLAFLGVLACLSVVFRRPLLVALTTVPLAAGLIGALGLVLLVTGRPFSLVGALMAPLILGIGIDDGIHIVHRFRQHQGEGLVEIFHHTGRAITITSFTTIVGFGALCFAEYGALRASGFMATMGIAACLVTSVVFLPALLTAVYHRDDARNGNGTRASRKASSPAP